MTIELPASLQDLVEAGPLTYLTTINADGSPQVTMIWIGLDEVGLFSTHMRFNAKLRNIERDPRVVLAFGPPKSGEWLSPYVVLHCTATIEPSGITGHLLSDLAKVYVGPDAEFPDQSQTGFVVHYAIDRIGGIGSWTGDTAH